MITTFTFPNGHTAQAIVLNESQDNRSALHSMGLHQQRPTLVVIGGASHMTSEALSALIPIFNDVVAPLAEELELYVVDGGTDAGVIHMMGQGRLAINGTFPLIGVAPEGKIRFPELSYPEDTDYERKELEPNHTHFALAPGDKWGNESPWIARVSTLLSGSHPSLTLLINGGKIAFTDLLENIKCERSAIILEGSGRLADNIAKFLKEPDFIFDPDIHHLLEKFPRDKLIVTHLLTPPQELRTLLQHYLTPTILNNTR
ncbi:MAG: hypothetical protein VKL39_04280 [Leptolyngbyaceae bacterium]|nr:hypothetical protein [Leptolyngbyaceae bacterium]